MIGFEASTKNRSDEVEKAWKEAKLAANLVAVHAAISQPASSSQLGLSYKCVCSEEYPRVANPRASRTSLQIFNVIVAGFAGADKHLYLLPVTRGERQACPEAREKVRSPRRTDILVPAAAVEPSRCC